MVVWGAWWGRAPVRERRADEGLVRCGILSGSSGEGGYRGRGGGKRPGEAEKRLAR
jgi:hypothetical protein